MEQIQINNRTYISKRIYDYKNYNETIKVSIFSTNEIR